MVVDVIPHEGGDHVVRVVVQRLQSHLAGITSLCSSRSEVVRFQLVVEEAVSGALVYQDARLGPGVFLDKLCRVVSFPRLHGAKIPGECLQTLRSHLINIHVIPRSTPYLLPPRDCHRVHDGSKSGDGGEHARVLQVSNHGSVSAHGVTGDTPALGVHGEQTLQAKDIIKMWASV